ncbi:YacL family protein [Shewanella sp. AS1]|uniref:YacL family protein n=1 Tax=Shewanella sp. AS1 TaxID=2907626 RepID=UPI001F36D110|nr:YacL family protein [Shewanella sp. AS1]MCE9677827.1 YacL family protein [Shewanella sp. AS1]
MEYEFRRNNLTGTLMANFSMDHEIMGLWFSDELEGNRELLQQLLGIIASLRNGAVTSQRIVGSAISIDLDNEQVRVFANVLETQESIELDESMSLYEGESEAFCGLEDFESALLSWQEFIDEPS